MRTWMKAGLMAVALPLAAQSVAAQDLDAMTPDELYEIAKTEGKVTVWSLSSRIAQVETAFEAKYPGIDLVPVDMNSTSQIARLIAEQNAGVAEVDVLYLSETATVFGELVPEGRLTRYLPPAIEGQISEDLLEPLVAHRLSSRALMYNAAAYPDGPPITNLWQLTTPEWRGKVLLEDPASRGEALDLLTEIAVRGDEMAAAYEAQFGKPIDVDSDLDGAGEQFIVDLFANDVILLNKSSEIRGAVGDENATDPAVGFMTYSAARDNERNGWALALNNGVNPSSGIFFPAVMAVARDAPHPAAARLAIDFMFGDDSPTGGPGNEPFYVMGDYSTRNTIEVPEGALPLEDVTMWVIQSDKLHERRGDILDLVISLQ